MKDNRQNFFGFSSTEKHLPPKSDYFFSVRGNQESFVFCLPITIVFFLSFVLLI